MKAFILKLIPSRKKINNIGVDPKDIEKILSQNDIHLIDVRQEDEYNEEHAKGAVNIPLVTLRTSQIPTGKDLYFICRTGARSLRACEILKESGIDSKHVHGGTVAWKKAGLKTNLVKNKK